MSLLRSMRSVSQTVQWRIYYGFVVLRCKPEGPSEENESTTITDDMEGQQQKQHLAGGGSCHDTIRRRRCDDSAFKFWSYPLTVLAVLKLNSIER